MSKTTVPSHQDIFVPESLFKKRKAKEQAHASKQANKKAILNKRKEKRTVIQKRAAAYHEAYLKSERQVIEDNRSAKRSGDIYIKAEPRLVFAIRIKGINKTSPKVRKALQLLRLNQMNNGVFIKLTKATQEILRIAEPFIAYGYPSRSTIRKLVYKRGFGKVNKQRIALSDNSIIEQELGKFDIICMEDLINEIYTVGPNFKQANNFLWPFKLSNPTGGWGVPRKFKHFIEGGSLGNREEKINQLILSMY